MIRRKILVLDESWLPLGPCHYCGGSLFANFKISGTAHTLPQCMRFITKDPVTFLRDMRLDRESAKAANRN